MNTISATNQILGRVAGCQHHAWGIRNPSGERSVFQKPLEFKPWFMQGIDYYSKNYGFVFELVSPGLLKIKRPGYEPILRTLEDFKKEHEEYEKNYHL